MGKNAKRGREAAARRTAQGGSTGRSWWLAILAVVVVGTALVVVARSRTQAASAVPEGTQVVEVGSVQHVQADVVYETSPPVGGDHNPVWQNCGAYSEPVLDENAVHSLEHGAVWITYRPDLAADQVDALEARAKGETHVLVSPRAELPGPIVASAWGRQLTVSSAADGRLDQFVRAFQQGPQTPELGARCSGGTGTPA